MYWLTKFAKHKAVIAVMAALALGLVLAPAVSAQTDFGLGDFEAETELGTQDLTTTVAKIINVALSLLGILAVVLILVGGFKWMIAGGNDERVADARKLILAGIIGLAIILSAFAVARFVIGSLSEATGTGDVTY